MKSQKMPKWGVIALSCALTLMTALAPGVRADEERDEDWYRNALEEYAVKIGKMQQRDTTNAAAEQIELMRGLVTEGRTLVANEELDDLDPIMLRLEKRADYVDAMLKRIQLEQRASQAEQAAQQAEQTAQVKQKEAADLKKRYEALAERGL